MKGPFYIRNGKDYTVVDFCKDCMYFTTDRGRAYILNPKKCGLNDDCPFIQGYDDDSDLKRFEKK